MEEQEVNSMEERKRLDPEYLERLAEAEYDALAGCLVRVRALNGYANEAASDTFNPEMTGKPVVVRISEASIRDDIHRWMDEWLDPAYPVEIVERGDLPESLHGCWIYGNCRSLDGGLEAGDIWAVLPEPPTREQIRRDLKEQLERMKAEEALDIEDIAARLGGKVCAPPANRRHMLAFMSGRDKEALYARAMEVSDQLTGRISSVKPKSAFEARLEALEAKVEALSARRCGPPPRFK
jgi:hypothetical protein